MSGEERYQFLDTNVLVYAHDKLANHKYDVARSLLQELWASGHGCLSIQVLQEFYVTITRKIANPLLPDLAGQIVGDLGTWHVHSPIVSDVQAAIDLQTRFQISFWDAMIIRSALSLGCDVLWSEDLNPGQSYAGVVVRNPFAVN